MRRAFTKDDFLNVREAKDGDELEYGRTNVTNPESDGTCSPVYGFWESNREVPVYVPDGARVKFQGKEWIVRIKDHQMVLEQVWVVMELELIKLSIDPGDWGQKLQVLSVPPEREKGKN